MNLYQRTGKRVYLVIFFLFFFSNAVYAQETVDSHLKKAKELSAQGKRHEAFLEVQEVLKLQPDHKESLLSTGYGYLRQGDFESALGYFKKLQYFHPNYGDGLYYLATTYLNMGDIEQARATFKLAQQAGYSEDLKADGILEKALEKYKERNLTFDYQSQIEGVAKKKIGITGNPLGNDKLIQDTLKLLELRQSIKKREFASNIKVETSQNTPQYSIEKWTLTLGPSTDVYWIGYTTDPSKPNATLIEVAENPQDFFFLKNHKKE